MINNIKLISSFASNNKQNIFDNILVKNGYITAQNDMNGICFKSDINIDFCCNATKLSSVLSNCNDDVKTSIKNKKIYLSSGKFKANISLIDVDQYPDVAIPESLEPIQQDIIQLMNKISVFTDQNDVRLFARGVCIFNNTICATNGHAAVKMEIDECNIDGKIIPTRSIQLMAKTNIPINSISYNNSMMFFKFDDGFMFSRIIDNKFPDIDKIMTEITNPTQTDTIFNQVESISRLCYKDKSIKLGKSISTRDGDALFDGFDINESVFNVDLLLKVLSMSDVIDFSKYPKPCPFSGNRITGAIAGILK